MPEKYIFWFEELRQDQNSLVGKKCANLGEIAKIGLPVPPGFALSLRAYEDFLKETNGIQEIRNYLQRFGGGIESIELFNEASRGIHQIVESKKCLRGSGEGFSHIMMVSAENVIPVILP